MDAPSRRAPLLRASPPPAPPQAPTPAVMDCEGEGGDGGGVGVPLRWCSRLLRAALGSCVWLVRCVPLV